MAEIKCMCDTSFEADLPDSLDLSEERDAEEAILDGSYLSFTCPSCGSTIKPDVGLRVTKPELNLDVFVIPDKERNRFLLGLTGYAEYPRVVIGLPELAEKITIYNEGLDDRAVELLKYYLLAKAGAETNPTIAFLRLEDDNLLFSISGIREDEIGIARIPREIYDKSLTEIPSKEKEEPFKTILAYPYVSITKVEIEETET